MNTLSIRSKLFIAIFLACTLAVSSGAALFHFRTQQAFQEYTRTLDRQHLESLATELENFYKLNGSWESLKSRRAWRQLQRYSDRRASGKPSPAPGQHLNAPHNPPTPFRTVLYDTDNHLIQGRPQNRPPEYRMELQQDGITIGYLGLYQRQKRNGPEEDTRFVNAQYKTLVMVGLLTLLSSFGIAWPLSRRLVKPIHSLRRSSSELANGNYNTRIEVENHDELGLLSEDFNRLAETLQEHEHARRQWIMDIAHELRTPISILRGEIEAIQDGISQADPDTIQSLHQETVHLQRLVEDLYTLSISDSGSLTYHKTTLNLSELLEEALSQFEHPLRDRQLHLETDIAESVIVNGDAQRLQQLFQNLIRNSLRYTDIPGKLRINLQRHSEMTIITFEDTPPGVPDESLPRLFDRLYRVESSRNRATGGAGIGLSISYNIVQAHNGTITATHSALGGLKITIKLPRSLPG